MKYLLSLGLIVLLSNPFHSQAQENLKFSKAILITMHSGSASNFIADEKSITVPPNKVWKIVNAKVFMTYDNRLMSDKTYLYMDEQIITHTRDQFAQYSETLWLPAGTYRLSIRTEEKNQRDGRFFYSGFISGVEYDAP